MIRPRMKLLYPMKKRLRNPCRLNRLMEKKMKLRIVTMKMTLEEIRTWSKKMEKKIKVLLPKMVLMEEKRLAMIMGMVEVRTVVMAVRMKKTTTAGVMRTMKIIMTMKKMWTRKMERKTTLKEMKMKKPFHHQRRERSKICDEGRKMLTVEAPFSNYVSKLMRLKSCFLIFNCTCTFPRLKALRRGL